MIKSVEDVRRAAFEKWFNSLPWPMCEKCSRDYEIAWRGFNAVLDAVEIKLPGLIGLDQSFTGTPISEIRAHNHYNQALEDCRAAIEQTGLGIRVK